MAEAEAEAEWEAGAEAEDMDVYKVTTTPMFRFRFDGFASFTTRRGFPARSPEFSCFGAEWGLTIYPGGDAQTDDGMMALWLWPVNQDEDNDDLNVEIEVSLVDRDGDLFGVPMSARKNDANRSVGWSNFLRRDVVIDPSNKLLNEGSLRIQLKMDLAEGSNSLPFAPPNPFAQNMKRLFLDEATADVLFAVQGQGNEGATDFHAHRMVLKLCAPSLDELCGSFSDTTPIPITRVKAEVFRLLLFYVYGGDISREDWKRYSKQLIDAADLYGLTNLKLEAELKHVKFTEINAENVVDLLVYADSKQCAQLKEVVMDFVVQHESEVLQKVMSSKDIPESSTMFTDLLAALARFRAGWDDKMSLDTMRVGALRRKLHEQGLDVDGSREALIARMKENATRVGEKRGRTE